MTTVLETLVRVAPIVAFLLSVTVLAELSDRVGVFDVAGHWMARKGGHRLWLPWLLFAGFAATCTIFLSLDTTAVLLTPVALAIAKQIDVAPRPFALTTLWLANTGSLLMPVSNLTNLFAMARFAGLGVDHLGYLRLALLPGLVSIAVTLVVVLLLHPSMLRRRYTVDPPAEPHDTVLVRVGLVVCLAVGPAFALGLPPWAVAAVGAAVLASAIAIRAPQLGRRLPVPWAMAAGFAALAVLVGLMQAHGAFAWLPGLVGVGTRPVDLLRLSGATTLLANAVNNLPAYLAVEHAVGDHPLRLMAALVGANVGPLITPWGSLATLLWLQRCRAAGVRWRLGRLALAGLLCATLTTVAATLTLAALS